MDESIFEDGNYILDGQMISESDFIETAQFLDNIEENEEGEIYEDDGK
jgi:hypothetical protein